MKYFLPVSLVSLSCLLILSGFYLFLKLTAPKRNIQVIPDFNYIENNGKIFTNRDLEKSLTLIVNHFSPTCEHCQYMAKSFVANKEQLKVATILMITIADSSSVAKFGKAYQLTTMPNIVLLRDTKYQFEKTFGTSVVPSFFIYKNNKLVKKIIGETKIDNLLAP